MQNPVVSVKVPVLTNELVELTIIAESENVHALKVIDEAEALVFGEAPVQLMEGFSYEYSVSEGYTLGEIPKVVSQSRLKKAQGRITPNIFVGSLTVDFYQTGNPEKVGSVNLEVRSVKTSYREDYRFMLEEITEKCTDLLMQINSPVIQNFTVDFNKDYQTAYQRFAFVKSLIDTSEFHEAVHRVLVSPVTNWAETEEEKDIRRVKRINNASIRQILSGTGRTKLADNHFLQERIKSVPTKLKVKSKQETVDTPENRFIKHALVTFSQFCSDIKGKLSAGSRAAKECGLLEETFEGMLNHAVFKEISAPQYLALNSPVLQRKEGYREVLRVWLMFDLAAKLIWHGGEDVYQAGKRDVATLYEYWLFFKLLDLFKEVFKIEPADIAELIKPTQDGLGLQLKSGRFIPLKGVYDSGTRKLNIKFSYNRTFSGNKEYPSGGSWTKQMRPDYTLSIWPAGVSEAEAETQELIVHIHFDAKYKIEGLLDIWGIDDEDLDEEKKDQKQGNYKRADLLKMHAYKDAIRRTAGAYVLYPGMEPLQKSGFHELIPGLGAFPVRPSKNNNGISELKEFVLEIVNHFLNRASQREKLSYRIFDIHKDENLNELNESIPEDYKSGRTLPPDDISVLVAFCKNEEQHGWIEKSGLYNARIETSRGSINLSPEAAGANYLLLHSNNNLITDDIWEITRKGPRVFSKKKMIEKGYYNPSQDYYLVYAVEKVAPEKFAGAKWDIRKLNGYQSGRGSALPFAVSLTELMKTKVKQF